MATLPHDKTRSYRAVVIGASAGGLESLDALFAALNPGFAGAMLLVQHLHSSDGGRFAQHLARAEKLLVVEPYDKEPIRAGRLYVAPANYHMVAERDGTISLTVDAKVNWSRPSIDVLFESAARCWGEELIAIILSGANADGAAGMVAVRHFGGLPIAQDPETAEYPVMPRAAIEAAAISTVLAPHRIGEFLSQCVFAAPVADASSPGEEKAK